MTDVIQDETTDTELLQQEVETLRKHIETLTNALQSERERAREINNKYCDDLDTIGTELLEWAEEFDVADEYESFVKNLNAKLNGELETRKKEFLITETYTVTRFAKVEAKSYDEAKDIYMNMSQASTTYDLMHDEEWEVESVDHNDYNIEESSY